MVKKVAIIGSGVTGAEVAYALTQKSDQKIIVELFEKEPVAGGRAHAIKFAGTEIEVGGTVVHSSNLLVTELMKFADVNENVDTPLIGRADDEMWWWDGKQVYLKAKNSTISFATALIKTFGPFSTWNFRSAAINAVNRWKRVYTALEKQSFENPFDLIKELNLQNETEVSLLERFRAKHVSDRLTTDFCGAIIQNMYLQNQNANAFAGEVGLAGAGLVGGHLFGIAGGNGKLFQKIFDILKKQKLATLHYKTPVLKVAKDRVITASGTVKGFDAVVIATPLELGKLTVLKGNKELKTRLRKYQPVHVTLVAGELNPQALGGKTDKTPSSVFVKPEQGLPYKSIGLTGFTKESQPIYKFFSDKPLPDSVLDKLFTKHFDQIEHHWDGAYPVLKPKNLWPDYELTPGVFYANGLETSAASLETNAVSALNTAHRVQEYLTELV
jgi:glycine/D-amino acid oxidase-like deaminating enzyme